MADKDLRNSRTKFNRPLGVGEARRIVGSLSFPSKLPGTSFGLSARDCKAGAELAKIPAAHAGRAT